MDWRPLFTMQHGHVHSAQLAQVPVSYQDLLLQGLAEAQIRLVVEQGQNSIAWLLWHIARCEDAAINVVIDNGNQVLDDGWCNKLQIQRQDIGTGMTVAEVMDLSAGIDIDALLGYRLAVARRTNEVVERLDDRRLEDAAMTDLEVQRLHDLELFGSNAAWLAEFWQDKPILWFLWLATGHCYAHLGEGLTVRSLAGSPRSR